MFPNGKSGRLRPLFFYLELSSIVFLSRKALEQHILERAFVL
jgi:hypothetical protein